MISIGISIYNAEKYLVDAINSVLEQTYENWELVLVDDGSTDNSLKIAQEFAIKDNRIRVISDGLNKKLPARLNQIINEAKYDYIARMDADDVMHPQRLEKQLQFLEKNKSCYERNQYSLAYPRAEDFELWTRAIKSKDFKMAVLPDLLLYYREEGNLSIDKIINSYKDTLKIYSKYHSSSNIDIEVLKLNFKIIISKLFYYTGNLQNLAMRRNTSFNSKEELEGFQKLLNQVIGED